MDLPKLVLEAPFFVGGATQDASYATLEDEIMVGEFPHVDNVFIEASLFEVTDAPPPRAR